MDKTNEILKYEKEIYCNYMFKSKYRYWMSLLKQEPIRLIWRLQQYSRKTDKHSSKNGFLSKLLYLYYISRQNRLGIKLGIEISTKNIGKGLLIYHGNIVVNGFSVIGENCHLHGDNCIGNGGSQNLSCPVIGNNVMLGVGAKVIGNVKIADNIKIAAGAVVVSSFLEPGITIGGVPARKIK